MTVLLMKMHRYKGLYPTNRTMHLGNVPMNLELENCKFFFCNIYCFLYYFFLIFLHVTGLNLSSLVLVLQNYSNCTMQFPRNHSQTPKKKKGCISFFFLLYFCFCFVLYNVLWLVVDFVVVVVRIKFSFFWQFSEIILGGWQWGWFSSSQSLNFVKDGVVGDHG